MSEKAKQLIALTQIRKLVDTHFPREDFYSIHSHLTEWIELEDHEEIEYDEGREIYVLRTIPICKVCKSTKQLTEIPTANGSFHICNTCKQNIASAKPETITA